MTRPRVLLLIEDNPGDTDLICSALETTAVPPEVYGVSDGEAALDFLLRRRDRAGAPTPELIILDLNLPKVDGWEVLSEIKRNPTLRDTPVIILTSSDAERDVVRGYSLGASCYVTKPMDLRTFQNFVRAIQTFWLSVATLPASPAAPR